MNKQETINELMSKSREIIFGDDENVYLSRKRTIELISQIHEPQKVVVPKFVGEWIEECKRSGWHLQKALSRLDDNEKVGDWAYDENDDLIAEKVDIFARAWLDGYEVEKEKLYTVEIPNNGGTLVLGCVNQAVKLVDGNKHFPGKFTKELIENAGFDWALKWAKEVE